METGQQAVNGNHLRHASGMRPNYICMYIKLCVCVCVCVCITCKSVLCNLFIIRLFVCEMHLFFLALLDAAFFFINLYPIFRIY